MICTGGGAGGVAVAEMIRMKSPFTVSQMEELENQALIFKYMIAGLPVPLDLMLPIQKSFDHVSDHSFFHHPTMGYCSFYRKVDPEPGRCKRTDGKKWRCSKDAYLDSKYCERHMHRGRNRSRKHVESKTSSASMTVTGNSNGSGMYRNLPLLTFGNNTQAAGSINNQSHYDVEDSIPFGIPTKDYRYLQGPKPEVSNHGITVEAASRNNMGLVMDSHLDNSNTTWASPPPQSSETLVSDNSFILPTSGFGFSEHAKQEQHSLRPFLDEWPTMRESWPCFEDERSKPGFVFPQPNSPYPFQK